MKKLISFLLALAIVFTLCPEHKFSEAKRERRK